MLIRTQRASRQAGMTLIEVLIAMLLLSGAMLAMASVHAVAVKYTKVAQFKGVAVQIGYDLADRMRANRDGNYAFTEDYDPDDDSEIEFDLCNAAAASNCTVDQIVEMDLGEIRTNLRAALPGGGLRVVPGANFVDIFIIWQTPEAPGSDGENATAMLACPDAIGGPATTQCVSMRVTL